MRKHFRETFLAHGGKLADADSSTIWHDRPDTVLAARVRRRSPNSVHRISLITDQMIAEKKAKDEVLNGSS